MSGTGRHNSSGPETTSVYSTGRWGDPQTRPWDLLAQHSGLDFGQRARFFQAPPDKPMTFSCPSQSNHFHTQNHAWVWLSFHIIRAMTDDSPRASELPTRVQKIQGGIKMWPILFKSPQA